MVTSPLISIGKHTSRNLKHINTAPCPALPQPHHHPTTPPPHCPVRRLPLPTPRGTINREWGAHGCDTLVNEPTFVRFSPEKSSGRLPSPRCTPVRPSLSARMPLCLRKTLNREPCVSVLVCRYTCVACSDVRGEGRLLGDLGKQARRQ